MRRTRLALIRGVATLVVATPLAVGAQDSVRVVPSGDALRRAVPCTGQRVNDIVIHSFAPTIAALRSVPVAWSLRVTWTLGTTPPLESRTKPTIEP